MVDTVMDMVMPLLIILVKDMGTNLLFKGLINPTMDTMVITPFMLVMVDMEVTELQQVPMQPMVILIITKVTISQQHPLRTSNNLEEKLQAQLKHKTHTS